MDMRSALGNETRYLASSVDMKIPKTGWGLWIRASEKKFKFPGGRVPFVERRDVKR